ncbi:MAG: NAD-dependent epimerase/dehydratase family protein [Promethearchaeota archaeon]
MKFLLTGAFGLVGQSTIDELLIRGHDVRAFDIKTKMNKKVAKKYKDKIEIFWGDIRKKEDVEKAVKGVDFVLHVAAIIPPLADQMPKLAEEVNVGGTKNIVEAMEKQDPKPKLVYTSSISVYGDRLKKPMIKHGDPLVPSPGDEYAVTKLKAESIIRESSLDWAIFRLSYITSERKLNLDPLMFHMPLDTKIEICDSRDVAFALVQCCENGDMWGDIYHLGGGERCRITYREYLDDMLRIFGFGGNFLPEEAFAKEGFHCGFYDTSKSQPKLKYQRHSLRYYYDVVKRKVIHRARITKAFRWIAKPIVKLYLLSKSPFFKNKMKRKT